MSEIHSRNHAVMDFQMSSEMPLENESFHLPQETCSSVRNAFRQDVSFSCSTMSSLLTFRQVQIRDSIIGPTACSLQHLLPTQQTRRREHSRGLDFDIPFTTLSW